MRGEGNGMRRLSLDVRRVIAALETKPETERALAEELDMKPSALQACLEVLIALDLIHIAAHVRERTGNRLIPTYAAGSKVRPSARRRRPKNVERLGMMAR